MHGSMLVLPGHASGAAEVCEVERFISQYLRISHRVTVLTTPLTRRADFG
jgi:hypothetical protein